MKGWLKKRWQCPVTESQLQVSVTGTFAGVAVSALPGVAAWVGAALLVVVTLRQRSARYPEPTLLGLTLTHGYLTIGLAALFLRVVCEAGLRTGYSGEWFRFAVLPALLFFAVHLAPATATQLWAESRGVSYAVRALSRSLPWIYFSAWLFSLLFALH